MPYKPYLQAFKRDGELPHTDRSARVGPPTLRSSKTARRHQNPVAFMLVTAGAGHLAAQAVAIVLATPFSFAANKLGLRRVRTRRRAPAVPVHSACTRPLERLRSNAIPPSAGCPGVHA